jgi:hypothetical protein
VNGVARLGGDIVLVDRLMEPPGRSRPLLPAERWRAERALRESPGALADVARFLGRSPLGATREAMLREAVRALASGEIVALEITPPAVALHLDFGEKEEPAGEHVSKRVETTWAEIQLLDQDDSEPVPYARYRVELPDGSIREGKLDAQGVARFVGIEPGSIKIAFPDIDAADWR